MLSDNRKDKCKLKKLYTLLLILFPFVKIYEGPWSEMNLAESIMLAGVLICMIFIKKEKGRFSLSELELIWILFMSLLFLMSIISFLCLKEFDLSMLAGRFLRWIFYTALLFLSKTYVDKKYAIKLIKVLVITACLILWVQIAIYYSTGYSFKTFIPGLEVMGNQVHTIITFNSGISIFRPTSLFLESSHFGYFSSLALAVILFVEEEKQNYHKLLLSLFISISVLASTSASGVGLLGVVIFFYLLNYCKNINQILKGILLVTGIIIPLSFVVLDNKYLNYGFDRFSIGSSRFDSFYDYFSELSGAFCYVGVGIGNNINYFENTLGMQWHFISGVGYIILQSGYIGLFIYIITMLRMYFLTDKRMRVFIVFFIAANSIEIVMLNDWLPLILMWPLYFNQQNSNTNGIDDLQ